MVVEPYAVRIARPTAIPSIRATVTTADAVPNVRRPAASTAAVERGVTVSPKPSPYAPSASATVSRLVSAVQRDIASRPARLRTMPPSATSRIDTKRTRKPDTSAPTAVAPASEPSASRCSSGPPYSTRSTNTAPPMIAVANA